MSSFVKLATYLYILFCLTDAKLSISIAHGSNGLYGHRLLRHFTASTLDNYLEGQSSQT